MKKSLLLLLALPLAVQAQSRHSADSTHLLGEVVVRGARVYAPNAVLKIPAAQREVPLTTNILPGHA